jgi:hypothetical protein
MPAVSPLQRSMSDQPLPLLHPAPKRRRRSDFSPEHQYDPVIGHVTSSGKFKCPGPECSNLSFGRQADFRRHYDYVHADKKLEFFCTSDGCVRSKRPIGKAKGRSFGTREDKMREHMRTVHDNTGKRKKKGIQYAIIEQEQVEMEDSYSEGEYKSERRQSKKNRAIDSYIVE